MGKLHTTDPNIGSYNVNSNNINSIITSDREIRVNATQSRAFMGPQRSGYHTMINSNMSNCNNVNSFITGNSTVIRGRGTSTISDYNIGNINSIINGIGSMADYNVGNINSIINDCLLNGKSSTTIRMGGIGPMASFDTDITSDNINSYTNGFQLNEEGISPSSMAFDTTSLSSNSNNARTLTSKGSGHRLKRFGKLVKKAFKVVTTTIGGIFAPSSSSKIQADKNARRNEVTPPPYIEVIENRASKKQSSNPSDCRTYLVYDGRKTLIGGSKTLLTDADIEKAVGDAIASQR